MGKIQLVVFMLAAIGCFWMGSVSAMDHIVGGSAGWTTPPNKTFFQDWAFPRTFGVGDRLVFPYRSGSGTVVVVNKEDFDKCTQKNVIYMYYNGPTIIKLTTTGENYYYSGVGKHCEAGQKLYVKVVNQKGSSGKVYPFKLVSKDTKIAAAPDTAAAAAPAKSSANDAAPAPAKSSATAIQSAGMASGLLTIFFSLFI
ncbi:umecyanin-like [Prunus avium]|uniref:Umecyanin-like n=1 Tax=Prunus avium TaxID=42229 RepID=A0A6P5SYE9_PRUAV|nr:umecyanin-like [Prunus avium]